MKDKTLERIIEKDDKKVDLIERAVKRVERYHDKADRKAENKALKRFEKIADREMDLFNRETKRDFW